METKRTALCASCKIEENEPATRSVVVGAMNPTRLRPRVASNGRISVRLNTAQRDLCVRAADTPRDLAYALRNAPVRDGKLSVRVRRAELDALIAAATGAPAAGRREERELAAFVRYLESLEERFFEPPEDDGSVAGMDREALQVGESEE